MSTPGCHDGLTAAARRASATRVAGSDKGRGSLARTMRRCCNEAETLDRSGAPMQGVARYALDSENAPVVGAVASDALKHNPVGTDDRRGGPSLPQPVGELRVSRRCHDGHPFGNEARTQG